MLSQGNWDGPKGNLTQTTKDQAYLQTVRPLGSESTEQNKLERPFQTASSQLTKLLTDSL